MPKGKHPPSDPNITGRALPLWLLGIAALLVVALLLAQLSGLFRGQQQPTTMPVLARPVDVVAPQTDVTQPSLQARLQSAIADNRILSPLDDNAIATLIELQTAQPDETALQTTLLELYPLAVQVVEGSLDRGELDLAGAQIALLARTGHASTSLDLLREKLDRELRARDLLAAQAEAAAARAATAAEDNGRPAPGTTAPPQALSVPAPQPSAPATLAQPPASAAPSPRPAPSATTAPGGAAPAAASSPASAAGAPAASAPAAVPEALSAVVETPPVQIAFAAPNYPPRARSRRIEGEVELAFTIDRNGEPVDIRVVRAEPPNTFDIEAIRAAQRWRFQPRRVNGEAVDTPMTRTLRFELGG